MKKLALFCLFCISCFGMTGNFNADCQVDFEDYAYLSNNWLLSTPNIIDPNTDLNTSGTVDINDLVIFATYWLEDCTVHLFCPTNPDKATSPDPNNHSINVLISKILTWSVNDCNTEETRNDVWFGETGAMIKVVSANSSHSYSPVLEEFHTYQWRIDTVNEHGTTTGDVWDFNAYTHDALVAATNPDPANHATGVSITATLGWSVADCGGEETKNDVWFGETGAMTKVVSESTTHNYLPTLEKQHSYQWRIDTVNLHGIAVGDVWDFNTAPQDAPVALDGLASAYAYIVCPITLIATDDGLPAPPARLKYVITELPDDVNAYLQDPTSGGQARIDANNLPYKLSSWGNTVWFATSTVGVTTFKFEAFDGELYSVETQVDVNTIVNPKDCLSFDGSGFVTIPDTNNYFDIEPNRGIGVCFATRQPFCTLFKKWELGKGGYEVGLIGGFISARVYDNNGIVLAEQKSRYFRYDDGLWHNVVVSFNQVAGRLELFLTDEWAKDEWAMDEDAASFPVANWPVGNDCNFVAGTGYKYEIDAIRSYNLAMTDRFRGLSSFQVHTAAGDTEIFVPDPIVRFKCDYNGTNNTATQIYDDKSSEHLIGTFSDANHVRYEPFFWHWYDSAAFQQHMRN